MSERSYNNDQVLISTAILWLTQGHKVILITVAKTWGSSPRPVGSLMLLCDNGQHLGSVSGGCVEDDLLQRYHQHELSEHFPTRLSYGVNREDASRFGLPCGGRIELVLEKIHNPDQLQPILEAIDRHRLIRRQVCLNTGAVLFESTTQDNLCYTDQYISKVFGSAWQLLVIGAGHLAQYVSKIALMLDYRVTVCDPREQYGRQWSLPETIFTSIMPDDAVNEHADQPQSAVVALSHDPKIDDMGLLQALESRAFYIGALGSKRSSDERRQRLRQLGLSTQQVERLSAPIGLAIGSHTPAEIAISIMAEITAVRNRLS